MTAPLAAPGSDSVRAQIAEVLREAMDERTYEQLTVCPNGCSCRKQTDDPDAHDCGCSGPCCMAVDWWDGRTDAEAYADVLVPLVDRLRAEAKAEALEEMADRLAKNHDVGPARRCRNRAAAYRTQPDGEVRQHRMDADCWCSPVQADNGAWDHR